MTRSNPPAVLKLVVMLVLLAGCQKDPGDTSEAVEEPEGSHAAPELIFPPPGTFYTDWQPTPAAAQPVPLASREQCRVNDPMRQVFFGDLHTHTAFSLDAQQRDGFQTPHDAYRFARGEPLGLSPRDADGRPTRIAQLGRPLDFAAVTDHAEWLGEVNLCADPDSGVYDTVACRGARHGASKEDFEASDVERLMGRAPSICGEDATRCRAALATVWEQTQEASERHYDRSGACTFTTFHAWEYSPLLNLSKSHRNVILRNELSPELPISWIDAPHPEDLWEQLKARCNDTNTGCEALTIPHNPNISNGRIFTLRWGEFSLTEQRDMTMVRRQMEPLVEMMQAKGESECRRGMWGVVPGEDEFCDFEKVRYIDGDRPPVCEDGIGSGGLLGQGCQSRLDFARYALIDGVKRHAELGLNPIQVGFIGSTDGHNGAPGDTDEYDYQGHNSDVDASLTLRLETPAYAPHKLRNPGGLAGLWAEENSRDSLFDAMKRREAFGTSGTRIKPRFFGGWDLNEEMCGSPDMVSKAYDRGIPMGGVLPQQAEGQSPTFLVAALADPGTADHPGTPLQRIQIIKGWVGEGHTFHEQIIDVAGTPDNGASVSRDTCELQGMGSRQLCGTWTDPDFDSSQEAVYYARVLENPSCRWNAIQCAALPESERPKACDDPEVPWQIQERAWTSPIWYEPATK